MGKTIELQEQKQILLEIMDEIDAFCRANQIKYFLIGGSLIGSVRHKGFIPWDDDIDIGMLREDYDRFLALFPNNESSKLRLLSLETDSQYGYGFAKVVDTRTVLEEIIDNRDKLGIYVDVFPLDNCTSSMEKASKHIKDFFFLRWLRNCKMIPFERRRSLPKNMLLALGKAATCCISRRKVTEAIVKRAKRFQHEESTLVAQMAGNVYGVREIWEKAWFSEAMDGEFEGRQYLIPREYDKVLTRTYGDYMQLPPEEKRVSHHDFVAYWR